MLVRFYEHDNDVEEGVIWNVSGGSLEGTKRHYRVLYDNGEDKRELELCIDITKSTTSLKK